MNHFKTKTVLQIILFSSICTCSAYVAPWESKSPWSLPVQHNHHYQKTVLHARKKNKRTRRGNNDDTTITVSRKESRNKRKSNEKINSNKDSNSIIDLIINKEITTKKISLKIDRLEPESPTYVRIIEVNDVSWWNNENNKNPYGARLWPSSLGLAQFLTRALPTMEEYDMVELGCGTGLVSIVASSCGANVIALDISNTVLYLTDLGWKETLDLNKNQETGTLECLQFDLSSKEKLPFPTTSKKKLVIGTAIMYESALAKTIAQRVFETCTEYNAWILLGDDDSGMREDGRNTFLNELDRLEKEADITLEKIWMDFKVKNEVLGWNEKNVKLLHINPPKDVNLMDSFPNV